MTFDRIFSTLSSDTTQPFRRILRHELLNEKGTGLEVDSRAEDVLLI